MIDLVIAEQMWVHIDWRMSTTQNLINSIDPSNKSCTLTPMDRLQYTLVFSEYGYSATKGREMAHQHHGIIVYLLCLAFLWCELILVLAHVIFPTEFRNKIACPEHKLRNFYWRYSLF